MDATRSGRDVAVRMTYDEAVVLFDLLHRWEDDGTLGRLPFGDQAEQRAVWDLTAVLEPMIDEAFDATYVEVVQRARNAVRDPIE